MERSLATARARPIATATTLLTVAIAVTTVSGIGGDARATSSSMPNILIIVTDDQRVGTDNICEPTPTSTPCPNRPKWMRYVRKWFRDGQAPGETAVTGGTAFSSAFAVDPLCCPSRASIFTGKYPHNHGVKTLDGPVFGVGPNDGWQPYTIQRYLQDPAFVAQRYTTAIFGKYLNGWDLWGPAGSDPDGGDPPPYFDEYGIFNNGYRPVQVADGTSQGLLEKLPGQAPSLKRTTSELPGPHCDPANWSRFYSTTYVADKAVDFIGRQQTASNPWFLYLAPYAPHPVPVPEQSPTLGCENYLNVAVPDLSPDGPALFPTDPNVLAEKPGYVTGVKNQAATFATEVPPKYKNDVGACTGVATNPDPAQRTGLPGYANCVREHRDNQFRTLKSVDTLVKQVFDRLTETNQADNTLALFVSDNGFLWGEYWLEGKSYPYSSSVRIPMLMRWPNGGVPPNNADKRLVANIDIAPTVLGAAGISVDSLPRPIDGRSLLPVTPNASAVHRVRLLLENPKQTHLPTGALTPEQAQARDDRLFPLWASLRESDEPGLSPYTPFQYTETYDDADDDITVSPPTPGATSHTLNFRELYRLTDAPQLDNLLLPSGPYPSGYPSASDLQSWIALYLGCSGAEQSPDAVPNPSPPNCP